MAVERDTSFEGNDIASEGFYDYSAQNPAFVTTQVYSGSYAMEFNPTPASEWARWRYASPPTTASLRFYLRVNGWETADFQIPVFWIRNPPSTLYWHFFFGIETGAYKIHPGFGAAFNVDTYPLTKATVSLNTWYRIEAKLDVSGTGHQCTWGWAAGEDALTTVDTAATGGNTYAASTLDHVLIGLNTVAASLYAYMDDVKFTTAGADYPLGGVAPAAAPTLRIMRSPLRW